MLPWYQSVCVLQTFVKQTVSEFLLQLQFRAAGRRGGSQRYDVDA